MKRITAIILATACVVGCSWDVNAQVLLPISEQAISEACQAGIELHDGGVKPTEMVEFLAYARVSPQIKQAIAACYSEAIKDER